jgi:hypothetical protein
MKLMKKISDSTSTVHFEINPFLFTFFLTTIYNPNYEYFKRILDKEKLLKF